MACQHDWKWKGIVPGLHWIRGMSCSQGCSKLNVQPQELCRQHSSSRHLDSLLAQSTSKGLECLKHSRGSHVGETQGLKPAGATADPCSWHWNVTVPPAVSSPEEGMDELLEKAKETELADTMGAGAVVSSTVGPVVST